MGCVLQDLEYQIGQLTNQVVRESGEDSYSNFSKKDKNKHKDKEIIKVEASLSQNVHGNVPQLKEKGPQVSSIKGVHEDRAKEE
jgi:hypothetical protein